MPVKTEAQVIVEQAASKYNIENSRRAHDAAKYYSFIDGAAFVIGNDELLERAGYIKKDRAMKFTWWFINKRYGLMRLIFHNMVKKHRNIFEEQYNKHFKKSTFYSDTFKLD